MVTPVAGLGLDPLPLAAFWAHALSRHRARTDAANATGRRSAPSFMEGLDGRTRGKVPEGTRRLGRAFLRLLRGLRAADERRVHLVQDHVLVDDALGDVLAGGQLVHHV